MTQKTVIFKTAFCNTDSVTTLNSNQKLNSAQKASQKIAEYYQNLNESQDTSINNNSNEIKVKAEKLKQERIKREKILNTKSSNGLSYIEAQKIIENIYKKFQGDFRTWTPNAEKSKTKGIPHYDIDRSRIKALMTEEDAEEFKKAEKACCELEKKFPEIQNHYETYRITNSLGKLELCL